MSSILSPFERTGRLPGAVLFGRGGNSIATPPCFPLYVCGVVVVASHNGAAVWNHECAI